MFRHKTRRYVLSAFLFLSAIGPATHAQDNVPNVSIKVAIVDKDLSVKPVPKFSLNITKTDTNGSSEAGAAVEVVTSFDGTASVSLASGNYVVRSAKPLEFGEQAYAWTINFKVEEGKQAKVELSNDNAVVTQVFLRSPKRRLSEEAGLFQKLRDGVVTVDGELGSGTGFIVDRSGLVITNQHVISTSREIRIEFERRRIVRAKLLAEDPQKDLAVLWVNLDACEKCKTLTLATGSENEPPIVEGEKVFSIGSPLYQDKIVTAGIVSKVEKHAIISDVNINPGNSGGPLFNSVGEVVGITTFGVQGESGPGVSGVVRIEEAKEIIEKARTAMTEATKPSAELMPSEPEDAFPIDAIKAKIDVKKFETKPYKADIGDYNVMMLTPVYKFYVSEKDRIEATRARAKRNKDQGAQGTMDTYKNLRNWTEYVGQLKPVVEIVAVPQAKATGKSLFVGLLAASAGVLVPPDVKFKADFYEMTLLCDGQPVTPIRRAKTEIVTAMPSYYKVKHRYTYAGIYTYPLDAFDPGKCKQLTLNLFSEETPTRAQSKLLDPKMRDRVWADFDEYRKGQGATKTPEQTSPPKPSN